MKVNTKILAFIVIMIGFLYSNPITTIAVLELEAQGMSTSEAAILTDRLRSTLIKVGQYTVVDRANMEEILTEQGFQQTGCTSDECVAEVGKLLGVQYMVSGSLGRFGKAYTIQLQILNVETGAIEHSSAYDYEGEMENLLKKGIRTALLRLLGMEEAPETISALHTGLLQLNVTPPESIVRIDGIEYNAVDVQNLEMLIGSHTIEVSAPYYYDYKKDIMLKRDTTFPLTISLKFGKRELERLQKRHKILKVSSWTSIGATLLSALLAETMYAKYKDATSVNDATTYRSTTETLDTITLGLSAISIGVSVYTLFNRNKENKLKRTLGVK